MLALICSTACGGADPSAPTTATSTPTVTASAAGGPSANTPTGASAGTTGSSSLRAARVIRVKPGGIASIATPTRNISCQLVSAAGDMVESVRCAIVAKNWSTPPRPSSCDLNFGDVSLSADGPGFVCAGDTVINPAATVLAYGDSVVAGRVTCLSTRAFLKCTESSSGKGFELARERYRFR